MGKHPVVYRTTYPPGHHKGAVDGHANVAYCIALTREEVPAKRDTQGATAAFPRVKGATV